MNPSNYSCQPDSHALVRLLSPKGLLFSALLAQVPDLGFFYEIPAINFPNVTKKIIESGQLELLPSSVYEERLVKSSEGHFLRLNMVEYFLFYFLYVLSSSNDGNVSGLKKHFPLLNTTNSSNYPSVARKFLNQLGGFSTGNSSLSFHWQADASSDFYLTLLKEYLVFMVPEIVPQLFDTSVTAPENILTTLSLKSSSPIWSRIDIGSRYSSFFTGILVEFWMNSYGYAVDEHGNPHSEPEFILPSVDFLQALQVVSRHYSSVYALSLSSYSNSTYVDPAYKTLASEAFSQIRLSFYRYLRVAISVWPVDGTLNFLVETWMSLVSPWFHLDPQVANSLHLPVDDSSPNFLSAWRPFIVSSFYLYQTIYAQFFDFSASALEGLLLSGDCEDLNEAVNRLGALTSSLLEIMNPLLSVAVIIKKLEIELTKSSSSFIRFSSSEVSQINEQLRILEPESFHPHSLFDSNVKLLSAKILLALDSLSIGIFRKFRQLIQSEEYKDDKFGKSYRFSYSLESINNDSDDFDNETEDRQNLFNFILESSKVTEDVKSLAKWSLQLRQDFSSIFQLNADDFKLAKESLRSSSIIRKSNPQIRSRGIKAPQPKAQLKYKLNAKPSYNASINPEGIIRSYEIGPLVPVLRTFSKILTNLLRSVILENIENKWNVKLPNRIWSWEINLRFLAAYPNIFFIILCWMVLRIVIKLIF